MTKIWKILINCYLDLRKGSILLRYGMFKHSAYTYGIQTSININTYQVLFSLHRIIEKYTKAINMILLLN